MLTLLLSLCCGLANSARGAGIKNAKLPVLLSLALYAYIITNNYWIAGFFWLPLALFWWKPGGPGSTMPYVVPYMQWRIFEFLSVFLYCLISGIIYNFIN